MKHYPLRLSALTIGVAVIVATYSLVKPPAPRVAAHPAPTGQPTTLTIDAVYQRVQQAISRPGLLYQATIRETHGTHTTTTVQWVDAGHNVAREEAIFSVSQITLLTPHGLYQRYPDGHVEARSSRGLTCPGTTLSVSVVLGLAMWGPGSCPGTRMPVPRGPPHADAVGNGREAVDALAHIPYDLVLMDCQMPEMDGYAASAEIRRREREQGAASRHTPIVAMTAHALEGDAEKCLAAGMDDYLPKPVTVQHLDTVLTRWSPQTGPGAPEEAVDGSILALRQDLQREGGPDILAEVIAVYLRDTPPHLTALHEAVARVDAEAMRREAHVLKGSSGQIGAVQVARLCADLEHQASTADLTGATETLHRLDEAFGRVRAHLQALAGGGNES